MSWTYQQSTGKLLDPAGDWVGTGYSGNGAGLNNPAMQEVPEVGPIPAGMWAIGAAAQVPVLGPVVMHLQPSPAGALDPFGRSGFFIHGDNADESHTASCGCIVLGPADRRLMAASPDRNLEVIP